MTTSPNPRAPDLPAFLKNFWFWAGAITLSRIALLFILDGDLGPDEAQYWVWAQTLDFGYFSKPPMIAWAIAATTAVFGDGEWATRLSAPLFHGGAAGFVYLTARKLFEKRVAFFSGLSWLTLPGVSISSALIATDAPLLFFWSGALYFMIRIMKNFDAGLADFAALGAMIGFGLLSKYAMLYFLAAFFAAFLLSGEFRKKFAKPALAITAVIAGGLFLPNIMWNAANDFQTVSHTAANANWGASLFKLARLAGFLASQFALFGPILFAALIAAFASKPIWRREEPRWLVLAIFAATPLLIVSAQAFISRAHANWAASAYPAAIILVIAFLFETRRAQLAKASLALHAVVALSIAVGLTNFALLDRLGAGRAVEELRGWKEMAQQVADAADAGDYDSILFDDRSMIAEMIYYQCGKNFEIATLDPNRSVDHFFEATMPFDPARHQKSLFVSVLPTDAHVDYRFSNIRRIGEAAGDLGAHEMRNFSLFEISGYHKPSRRKKISSARE